ncbi:MAG TPA: carboxypeptidase-like regulatory domain-containing protein [Candidatus Rubrimentiphilum sp.]|nr:carboxypeptidase-like regulatory domain-containing protein [Candidatus Rubrimentiphilum sp.]
MHSAQTATPPLAIPGSSLGGIHPFEAHGGIASYQMGDAAPAISGKQLTHLDLAIQEIDVTDASGRVQVVASYSDPLIVDVLQYQDGSGANVGSGSPSTLGYRKIKFVINVPASRAIYADGSTSLLQFEKGDKNGSSAGAGNATDTDPSGPRRVAITDTHAFSLNAGEILNVDFNAFESLGNDDGGILHVRPVLFSAVNTGAGRLTGRVVNHDGQPVSGATVTAFDAHGGIANACATDANGNFELHTISAGTYQLNIYNDYTNAAGVHFKSRGASSDEGVIGGTIVIVNPGASTSAGTIGD